MTASRALRVLVADDDPIQLRLAARLLRSLGHSGALASNGRIALDLLDKHGARAVFFLIGERARQHPGLVAEIARRGHEIGNHSQTHPAGCFWLLRPWQLWREVAGCQETLRVLLGRAPVWFRPPVGHHNLFLAPILRALGLRMMIWNCRGFDGVEREVSTILRHIERGLRPGSIILLHEGRSVSPVVLGATLEMVARKGLLIAFPKFL